MHTITWLHLSDLHFRASDAYNMDVVLEAFLQDVPQLLVEDGLHPDFLVVTGDIAFSGQTEEYELAWHFLDGLREQLNELPEKRLFIVPGNHDVNRKAITPVASAAIASLDDPDKVNMLLGDKESVSVLLRKFDNYAVFLQSHFEGHPRLSEKHYFFVRTFELAGRQVAIMGLNSAWASVSDEDDKVKLLLGERQVREAVKQAGKADIRLALMHHPFELLKDFDREVAEAVLTQSSHFILMGHRHDTRLVQQLEPDTEVMVLSAGACYQKRREFNSCNCVSLDLEAGNGTVYLYAYSDKRGGHWVKDTFTYPNLLNGEWLFELPTSLTVRHATAHRGRLRHRSTLDGYLSETVKLHLSTSFERDQYAQLDQAGETDPERSTLLRRVFVDLEVEPRRGPQPRELIQEQPSLFPRGTYSEEGEEIFTPLVDKALSAMEFFMKEQWPQVALIGGPGSGKSTLGQYLAQVHRATLLGRTSELYEGCPNNHRKAEDKAVDFEPRIPRLPFRVVLKYFAQWLSEDPPLDSLEAYLAGQVHKNTSRAVSPEDIQYVLCHSPCLMVFDGLDEVLESTLRNRMLARLREFLGRADQLGADLQVLATSRPTGYNDQFSPELFLHLNLLSLSSEKVGFYARRWTRAKVPLREERERILETLEECQKDEQVEPLLTTPLQVTIVLLIIKDGGRPPRQREALFNEYWGTIFRREKAKAKWIIRTEEPLLFDLHAYLAYLLHRRAAGKDLSSLLPEAEFYETVRSFLRQKDTVSSDESIGKRAAQLVSEARDRLVLLVEPQPGLFGFELRPLQEFFVAAYLSQTARDTVQRFERFKAIARLDHWHNVGLFFAGRIVRTFTGEAANVLELVCRPVDRELPDRYLRRGAWLAIDIAADGSFAANRDLQYSAVEYGLSVLGSGLADRQREHLGTALSQLPLEDQRDILRPVLKEQLRALPPPCLEMALDACGKFLKSEPILQNSLQICLATGKPVDILAALDLAVRYKSAPGWLATQLQHCWPVWGEAGGSQRLQRWWSQSPEYVRTVLLAWSPSDEQINELLDGILAQRWYWYSPPDRIPSLDFLLGGLSSPLDQTIATLECWSLLQSTWLVPRPAVEDIDFGGAGGISFVKLDEAREQLQDILGRAAPIAHLRGHIQALLTKLDLLPHLRASLWILHWALNTPTPETAAVFLEEIDNIAKTISLERGFLSSWLGQRSPLLAIAVRRLESGDRQGAERLLPLLDEATQLDISEQVSTALRDIVRGVSRERQVELFETLRLRTEIDIPQLAPLADSTGIKVEELIQAHVPWWIRAETELSSAFLRRAFAEMEGRLHDPEKLPTLLWTISSGSWSTDPEVLAHGRRLLSALLGRWGEYPMDARAGIVNLFLTLLAYDPSTLEEAPRLLRPLADAQDLEKRPLWRLLGHFDEPIVRAGHLAGLTAFISHSDKAIREGASILWEALISALLSRRRWEPVVEELKSMRLSWRAGWNLVRAQDRVRRQRGIALLTLSDFPVEDEACQMELLNAMAACQETDESEAWARLILNIPMPEVQEAQWRQLLEAILSHPQKYTQAILAAAVERYTVLAGQSGPDIPVDGANLGLPPVT
jgi:predicted MPP superfamily phosphohydrolase